MAEIKTIPDLISFSTSSDYAVRTKSAEDLYKELHVSSASDITHIASVATVLDQKKVLPKLDELWGISERKEFVSFDAPENYPFFFLGAQLQTDKEIHSEILKIQNAVKQFSEDSLSYQEVEKRMTESIAAGRKISTFARQNLGAIGRARRPLTGRTLTLKRYPTLSRKERRPLLFCQKAAGLIARLQLFAGSHMPSEVQVSKLGAIDAKQVQAARERAISRVQEQGAALTQMLTKGAREIKTLSDKVLQGMMQFLHE